MLINAVAPFAGAWIEIFQTVGYLFRKVVAPFAGAWIEMILGLSSLYPLESLPSRERGLKSRIKPFGFFNFFVAPFAGACQKKDRNRKNVEENGGEAYGLFCAY